MFVYVPLFVFVFGFVVHDHFPINGRGHEHGRGSVELIKIPDSWTFRYSVNSVPEWKKLTVSPAPEGGHAVQHFWSGYRTDTVDAEMPLPTLVFSMQMANNLNNHHYNQHIHSNLTLIPTGVTIYGSHYFQAKFLKKLSNNTNLKKLLTLKHFI
jgi:hypothetical protein